MDLNEIGWEGMDWTNAVQDRGNWQAVANTAIKLHVPENVEIS